MRVANDNFYKSVRRPDGFSLVELLTVIAVITVIAGLVLPYFGDMTNTANEKKDQRNAQTIASTAECATAAGAQFIVAGDLEATIKKLRIGASPDTGAFKGRVFKLPGISDGDISRAMPYLTLSNNALQFHTTATP
jgi:prepilin-type N-terminal cleavage/methylation domain-containing protein